MLTQENVFFFISTAILPIIILTLFFSLYFNLSNKGQAYNKVKCFNYTLSLIALITFGLSVFIFKNPFEIKYLSFISGIILFTLDQMKNKKTTTIKEIIFLVVFLSLPFASGYILFLESENHDNNFFNQVIYTPLMSIFIPMLFSLLQKVDEHLSSIENEKSALVITTDETTIETNLAQIKTNSTNLKTSKANINTTNVNMNTTGISIVANSTEVVHSNSNPI